jgi:hypothetical protein
MIKTEVIYKGGTKLILLNPDAIVCIEQVNEDLFELYLVNGKIYQMTLQMFQENFEEEEETIRS